MSRRARRRGPAGRALVGLALACLLASGCARPASPPATATDGASPGARPWPEADRLFRTDPRWLGGDAALSVELPGGRILWLFGDSFVAREVGATRRAARMIRNSVAIQRGANPADASIAFHYRHDDAGLPASFFPEPEGGWYWPGHGIVLDGQLTLFLHRIERDAAASLGFVSAGFVVVRIDNPGDEPLQWRLRELIAPPAADDEVVGATVLLEGDHVYASLVREPGDQALSLVRWRRRDFVAGELAAMERFTGQGFGAGASVPVAAAVGTELSLSRRAGGGFVLVHSGAFGASPLMFRVAPRLTGPWGEARPLHRPEEAAREGVLVYAAKAHPELEGAPLVVTYATNTLDADRLLDDDTLYYPRFVRASPGPAPHPSR